MFEKMWLHRSSVASRRLLLITSQWHNNDPRVSSMSTMRKRRRRRAAAMEEIKLPKKKKMDSLTVLKALSSTVGTDFNGCNLTNSIIVDAPYLNLAFGRNIPKVDLLGRNAARSVLLSYPKVFKESLVDDPAVPEIKDYLPANMFSAVRGVSEEALLDRIRLRKVEDADYMYGKMKEKGISVSQATMEHFLELLCYYGDEDEVPKHPLERFVNSHRDNIMTNFRIKRAFSVFREMTEKTPAAYNSFLRALLDKRLKLNMEYFERTYQEMEAEKISYERSTFHSLMKNSDVLSKMTKSTPTKIVYRLLQKFHDQQHSPTVDTFNAALEGINTTAEMYTNQSNADTKKLTLEILSEMKHLHIEPTLFTFSLVVSNLLQLKVKDDTRRKIPYTPYLRTDRSIVSAILDEIEKKQYEFTEFREHYFLLSLMLISDQLNDPALAHRIERFRSNGRNQHFLTYNRYCRKVYIQTYLNVVMRVEGPEKFIELYRKKKAQGHFQTLSPEDISNLISDISEFETQDKMEHLVELVKDANYEAQTIFASDFAEKNWKPKVQLMLAECMNAFLVIHHKKEQFLEEKALQNEEGGGGNTKEMSNKFLGDVMKLNLSAGYFDNAWQIFQLLSHTREFLPFGPYMELLVNHCLKRKKIAEAIEVMEYVAAERMSCLPDIKRRIFKTEGLSKTQIEQVKSL